ncbi:MAG: hypothetical protein ACK4VW_07530 [Anaerolineales bacterium]
MNGDGFRPEFAVWLLVLVFLVPGFLIQIEQPAFLYAFRKTRLSEISIFLLLLYSFERKRELFPLFLALVIGTHTLISLMKLINAFPPNRLQAYTVHVLDVGPLFRSEHTLLVVLAELAGKGRIILPPFQGLIPRPGQTLTILLRRGRLGIFYRFSFDPVIP